MLCSDSLLVADLPEASWNDAGKESILPRLVLTRKGLTVSSFDIER